MSRPFRPEGWKFPTTQSGPNLQPNAPRPFGNDIVYRPKPTDPRLGVPGKPYYGPHKPWPRGNKPDPRRGTSARQEGGGPTTPGFPSGPWRDGGPSPT